jgi:hypothetical protein
VRVLNPTNYPYAATLWVIVKFSSYLQASQLNLTPIFSFRPQR